MKGVRKEVQEESAGMSVCLSVLGSYCAPAELSRQELPGGGIRMEIGVSF